MINSFKNPAIMRILRTTERHGAGWREQNFIPCEEDYTSFNSIMQPIFELIISNRIESRKLAALRDELLPKLMTGEIDVSDVQL